MKHGKGAGRENAQKGGGLQWGRSEKFVDRGKGLSRSRSPSKVKASLSAPHAQKFKVRRAGIGFVKCKKDGKTCYTGK